MIKSMEFYLPIDCINTIHDPAISGINWRFTLLIRLWQWVDLLFCIESSNWIRMWQFGFIVWFIAPVKSRIIFNSNIKHLIMPHSLRNSLLLRSLTPRNYVFQLILPFVYCMLPPSVGFVFLLSNTWRWSETGRK